MTGQLMRPWTLGWTMAVFFLVRVCSVEVLSAQQTTAVIPGASNTSRVTQELLARQITISLDAVSRGEALDSLARVSKIFISYEPEMLNAFTTKVSIHAAALSLGTVLEQVLDGTGMYVTANSKGPRVLMVKPVNGVMGGDSVPLTGTIMGRVIDSTTGHGITGATVNIDGTKLAGAALDSGRFTLKNIILGDRSLTVRVFGYLPAHRSVTVTDGTPVIMRIVLIAAPNVLSGVVTTATGLQRKIEVGNDITSINVDSVMHVAPITSVTDLLETRVPGMTVSHTSGAPGDPSRIRLRGASSLTGNNDPIVIVDGVRVYGSQSDPRNQNLAPALSGGAGIGGVSAQPVNFHGSGYTAPSPLDQIDPNSIETIEVFKGPSASALYGSDAANGVIVITTKHGRAGPTHWDLALGQGVNWLPGSWPTNYYKFGYDGTGLGAENGDMCLPLNPNCTVDSLVAFQALNNARYSVFSHGSDQTASLTISGGVPTVLYSLSGSAAGNLGYLKLPGIEQTRYENSYGTIPSYLVRPDNYKTYGGTGALTVQPNPNLRVALTGSLFNSTQQQSSLDGAIVQLEGEYIDSTVLNGPLIQSDVERAIAGTLTSTYALSLHWQLMPWLPVDATGGLNTIQRVDETYIPYGVNSSGVLVNGGDTTGSYGLGRGTSQDKTLTIGTTIPRRFITTAIGANLTSESTADFSAYTNQLSPGVTQPTSFPTSLINGNEPSTFSQQSTAASTYGWYMEPRLNVNSRFFVAPGFRLDGGSASGAHGGFNGSGLSGFPKIDLSYVAVDQSHPRGWLTLFRPRLAFGYAGTQPGPAEKLRLLNVGGGTSVAANDSAFLPIVSLSSLGNTRLRPETSREFEGGFDAELWQGRFSMTWTEYNKTRFNAIASLPVAPSVYGNENIEVNFGVVRNTGAEVTMQAQVLSTRAVSWYIGSNISHDNNLVVRLNPTFMPDKNIGIVAGYPLFSRWALPLVAFADVNHDGLLQYSEVQVGDSSHYVGQQTPKYTLNLNTGILLLNGRLNINATFAYQNGLTQDNASAVTSRGAAQLINTPGTSLATQAAVVASGVLQGSGNFTPTDIGFIQTVNTFRFNDLSINYKLPRVLSSWFRIPNASVALQGSNLMLRTNYRGIDPNVNAFSTVSAGDETIDTGQIPEPRTWWLKLALGN